MANMAAWALNEIDPTLYETNVVRLGPDIEKELNMVIKMEAGFVKLMLFDKIIFLSSMEIFKDISGLSLSFLADISEEELLVENASLSLDEMVNNNFYILYEGEIDYFKSGEFKAKFRHRQFIAEMLSLPGIAKSNILLARKRAIFLRINKDQLYELLAENVKLANRVLEYV